MATRGTGVHGPAVEPFRCDVSYHDRRAVLALAGEMDMANAPGLLQDVLTVLDRPVLGITLDLQRVTYVDSCGIGTLVAAQYRATQRGIAFELTGVPDQARRIFEITDLAELFGLTDPSTVAGVDESDSA
jgi:anti-sigma B factor antagonist